MRVLLVTPPMTQLNTPYPATAYLTGCLRRHAPDGVQVAQADLSIELFLRLFSREGLRKVRERLEASASRRRARQARRPAARRAGGGGPFPGARRRVPRPGRPVIAFLQGRDPSLAMRIVGRTFLPEGPRFAASIPEAGPDGDDPLGWAFGDLGTTDRARHLASLFVDDLADVFREGIDPRFELSRYGEKLAASASTFDALAEALAAQPTLVDAELDPWRASGSAARPPTWSG